MWLPPIAKIRMPGWVTSNKGLKNAVLLCAGLFCVNLLLFAVLVLPSGASLRSWETKYQELRKRRAEAVLFEKQKDKLAGVRAGILTQKDMPLLIKDLVQSARGLNIAVSSSIQYDVPKQSGEEPAMLSFQLPLEGRYADIKRYIYEIETSDKMVGIQDLKLEGDKGRVKVQMKLVTYLKGQ